MNVYFGTYRRFETPSKKEAAALLGADNLVGDVYQIEFVVDNGRNVAWLKNRFGASIGYFDEDFSRELSIMAARGWVLKALLSLIAFTDSPDPGYYWGEAAVICFDAKHEKPFETFISTISGKLAEGLRPEIALGEQGVQHIIESNGNWISNQNVPLPKKEPGTVIMKDRRSMSERMVEKGRQGNKGCYLVSWLFIAAAIALLIFALKSCGLF